MTLRRPGPVPLARELKRGPAALSCLAAPHPARHPNCGSEAFFYYLGHGFLGVMMRNMNPGLMALLHKLSVIHDLETGSRCVTEYASICGDHKKEQAKAGQLLAALESTFKGKPNGKEVSATLNKAYAMNSTGGAQGIDWAELYGELICKPATAVGCKMTFRGRKSALPGCAMNTTSKTCEHTKIADDAQQWANFQCLSNGKGPFVGDGAAFKARLAEISKFWETPHTNLFVNFYLDKHWSKTNHKSQFTRGFYRMGFPLAGYKARGSRDSSEYKEQTKKFVDWFLDDVQPRYKEASKDDSAEGLEMLYLVFSVTFGEILDLIIVDMLLAWVSFFFVLAWLWFQTSSLLLACVGMTEITLSLPMAYFVYTHVLGFEYFDFMCSLGLYILMAIGADDVFIWVDAYKQSAYQPGHISATIETRFSWAWRRASYAMLITSLTTFAAFMAATLSPLLEIKSFGVFVAFAIMLDYVYVITWLPSATVIFHRHFEHAGFAQCRCPDKCRSTCGCLEKDDGCCQPMQSEHWLGVDPDEGETVEMRRMEIFFDGWFSSFVTHKTAKYVLVACGVLLLIPFTIFAFNIGPSTKDAQILPDDHPMQRLINVFNGEFAMSGMDPKVRLDVLWGVKGLDRDGIVSLQTPKEAGVLLLDEQFDWNKPATQLHVLSQEPEHTRNRAPSLVFVFNTISRTHTHTHTHKIHIV